MNSTYVITLDALDLSLLPTTYRPRRSTTPIWNRNDELTEYTIQVNNTSPDEPRVTEEPSKQTLRQTLETTTCHMCKVDVPKHYLKEHKNSPKHKTYTRIANVALKRIKEQINDGCECDETRVNTSTYFCTHCIAVVNNDERESHEASHSHKNSMFLDKCLIDFLNLYTNIDETDMGDNKLEATKKTKQTKIKNENEDRFDMKNYLKMLKHKYKMAMKLRVVDEETLEVEIDGSRVEFRAQNFHGLKTTSGGLDCVVCKETVDEKDKIEHLMSAKHMYRVSTPFKDVHCKREIYPSLHHCVLCNIIIDDSSLHTIFDPGHHRLLQEALLYKNVHPAEDSISSDNWTLVTNKTSKSDSTNKESSLNRYSNLLDTDNNSMTSKEDVLPAANKTFCSHCNVYIVTKNLNKHTNTKKHLCNTISKYYYLFNLEFGKTSCRVCDVIVNGVDDFEKHINTSDHVINYNNLLAANKVRNIDSNQLFCGVCDKLVLVKNELYHIKGCDHVQNLQSNKESSPTTSNYHCDICDVRVPNTANDIQTHNESISHNIKKFTIQFDSVSAEKTNTYFYNYTMLETQAHNLVNCSVCDLLVPKDEQLVQKHLENEMHIEKYKQLLRDHRLVLHNDNIHCNICNVYVGLKSEIMHARGKKHLKNLHKTEEKSNVVPAVEDNARLETRVKVKASGVNISDADLNVILEHFDISDTLKELVCKTCKVTVPFTMYNCLGHLEGSRHKQKLIDVEIVNESTSASNINLHM